MQRIIGLAEGRIARAGDEYLELGDVGRPSGGSVQHGGRQARSFTRRMWPEREEEAAGDDEDVRVRSVSVRSRGL